MFDCGQELAVLAYRSHRRDNRGRMGTRPVGVDVFPRHALPILEVEAVRRAKDRLGLSCHRHRGTEWKHAVGAKHEAPRFRRQLVSSSRATHHSRRNHGVAKKPQGPPGIVCMSQTWSSA